VKKVPTWLLVSAAAALFAAGVLTALGRNTLDTDPLAAALPAIPIGQPPSADDTVQRALRDGKPTVAEFGANACVQCREMKPVLEALRRARGDHIAVAEVDLIAQREHNYISRYGIQLMPTQIFYDAQGREIGRHQGRISGEEILARLKVPMAAVPATPAPGKPS
jgi:thioredoxin 1